MSGLHGSYQVQPQRSVLRSASFVPPLCASAALAQEEPALAADQGARTVLDRELPGLTAHKSYEQFKAMSLQTLMPLSRGLITDKGLATVEAGLRALGTSET